MRKALKMSLLLGTILVLLAITACGVDGDYKSNKAPEIRITSWEGAVTESAADTLESLVFQQRVYWNATDEDGTIAGIAYRILDENGTPIATPGNSVIDEIGELEPVVYEGNQLVGWVVHYKPGADENIPLTSNQAKKTVWSQNQYTVVNFPANEDGEPAVKISSIEVIAIDNRGSVSNIARRSFKTESSVPNCILSTSRGNPDGKEVGTGLFITFSMSTIPGDPLAVPGADYYEYKLGKYIYDADADSLDIPELVEETSWFTTTDREVILTKNTTPPLTPDFDGTETDSEQLTFTRITAHAYNYAGVKSNESIIEFAVKEGFHPKTVIYPQKTYALGDNHYKDYVVNEDLENYPYLFKDGPIPVIYATSFFTDSEGRKTVVNSPNLKVFSRWGYYGQYGTPPTSSTGAIVFSDSPYDTEVGRVLNEADNKDYYSEIIAYDIRFDDAPFDFFALSQNPDNLVTHVEEDGTMTEWLRVPKTSVWSISRGLEIGNLAPGYHKLEVSAVDLQFEYDPTPAVFEFYIADPVPQAEKDGIMVLEASTFPSWSSTQVYADSVYREVLADYPNVDFFKRSEINAITGLQNAACNLAYSDVQKYKTVIYREEAAGTTYFGSDYDVLKLYLNNGGNVILSSAGNLKSMNDEMVNKNRNMFRNYFGIDFRLNAVVTVPANKWFFDKFMPTTNIASLSNLPEMNLYLEEQHNALIFARRGLSDLSYFAGNYATPDDNLTQIIYRSDIKEVGDDAYSPATIEEYNQFNDLPLAVGKITNQNRCFVFGFPLSYMNKSELTLLFEQLLNE
ncbi:hypothetical protein JEZ13_10475 [bacterium]|nr:hypothetical protein [bacterium]